MGYAKVKRRCFAAVGLIKYLYQRMVAIGIINYLKGFILLAVIHKNDLKIRIISF